MADGENATEPGSGSRRVWIVTDAVPGHEARSRGILAALGRLGPVAPVPVSGALRGSLARGAMIASFTGGRRPPLSVTLFAHGAALPAGRPDLVVGAGGRTQFLTLALAERFSVPSIFAGLPRHLSGARFTAVVAPYPVPGLTNLIEVEMPLSDVEPERAEAAGAALRASAGGAPVWSMLAGGDGAGYRYTATEWQGLGAWLGARSAAAGARLCVTTSRRTGATGEAALMAGLGQTSLLEKRFWLEGAQGGALPLIGAADLVFATADSATMIGEAVASGRPVVVLEPSEKRPALRHTQVLAGLSARGRIRLIGSADLQWADLPPDLCPLTVSPVDSLASALARRLAPFAP